VTDLGLVNFNEKQLPLKSIVVNGLSGVSSLGLSQLVGCCMQTLVDFEGASLD